MKIKEYGDKNPFYGRTHTEQYKKHASSSRKGKWSYNAEQYEKQKKNTPKGENHHNWKGGISNGKYPFGFNKKLKTKIKDNFNHSCQICNATNKELVVHHINYIKEDISEENLIPLCASCHGKTNFNRTKWIQFFKRLLSK